MHLPTFLFICSLIKTKAISSSSSLPSCNTVQTSALELLSSNTLTTSVPRPSEWQCPVNDSCASCVLDEESGTIATTCSDGCAYSFDGLTVTRSTSVSNSIDPQIHSTTVASGYKFSDGAIGDFGIKLSLSGGEKDGPSCEANYSGQTCSCDIKFCDIDQTTVGYTADCTNAAGGILYDSCNPQTMYDFTTTTEEEDIPLMAKLIAIPNLVSSSNNIVESKDGSGKVIALDTTYTNKFKPRAAGGKGGDKSSGAATGTSMRLDEQPDDDNSSFTCKANGSILSFMILFMVWIFV